MVASILTVKLDGAFKTKVRSLAVEGKELSKAYSQMALATLDFAKALNDLWLAAGRLDGNEYGAHREHLLSSIRDAIGTDSRIIRSRWLAIGEHSSALRQYKTALPPTRDNLYEVALAIKEDYPVKEWVKEGLITPETSVREIRKLRDHKKKRSKKKKRNPSRQYTATLTLCFESYDDAIRILGPLLTSDEDFKLLKDKTIMSSLAELDEDEYEKASNKLL